MQFVIKRIKTGEYWRRHPVEKEGDSRRNTSIPGITVKVWAIARELRAVAPKARTSARELRTVAPKARTNARELRAVAPKARTIARELRAVVPKVRTIARELRAVAPKVRTFARELRTVVPKVRTIARELRAIALTPAAISPETGFEKVPGKNNLNKYENIPERKKEKNLFQVGIPELIFCTTSMDFLSVFQYFWPVARSEFSRIHRLITPRYKKTEIGKREDVAGFLKYLGSEIGAR